MNLRVGELEFTKAGYMRGWYEYLKGGWRLQEKNGGGVQYIRNEDRKLLRKLEEIRERCKRYLFSLLNTTLTTLDQTII